MNLNYIKRKKEIIIDQIVKLYNIDNIIKYNNSFNIQSKLPYNLKKILKKNFYYKYDIFDNRLISLKNILKNALEFYYDINPDTIKLNILYNNLELYKSLNKDNKNIKNEFDLLKEKINNEKYNYNLIYEIYLFFLNCYLDINTANYIFNKCKIKILKNKFNINYTNSILMDKSNNKTYNLNNTLISLNELNHIYKSLNLNKKN